MFTTRRNAFAKPRSSPSPSHRSNVWERNTRVYVRRNVGRYVLGSAAGGCSFFRAGSSFSFLFFFLFFPGGRSRAKKRDRARVTCSCANEWEVWKERNGSSSRQCRPEIDRFHCIMADFRFLARNDSVRLVTFIMAFKNMNGAGEQTARASTRAFGRTWPLTHVACPSPPPSPLPLTRYDTRFSPPAVGRRNNNRSHAVGDRLVHRARNLDSLLFPSFSFRFESRDAIDARARCLTLGCLTLDVMLSEFWNGG